MKMSKFQKIWRKVVETQDKEKMEIIITTIGKEDLKEEREGRYGKEQVFKFNLGIPKDLGEEVEVEFIYNPSDKALGHIIINGTKHVIWKNQNDRGVWYSFRNDELGFVNVEKKPSNNDIPNFKFTIRYILNDNLSDNEGEEELEFDIV